MPEDKDIPARVTLMQLPARQEIRVRNLFNVVDCKLHWQKNGDYLCVKVDRTPKGTQVCGFCVHKTWLHLMLILSFLIVLFSGMNTVNYMMEKIKIVLT